MTHPGNPRPGGPPPPPVPLPPDPSPIRRIVHGFDGDGDWFVDLSVHGARRSPSAVLTVSR